jgi:nitrite reductase/ring-hydroxylating ferredoxin subunit
VWESLGYDELAAVVSYTEGVSEAFYSVGPTSRFPNGKIRRVFIEDQEIAVVCYGGCFYAFSNRCTHNDFQLHFGFIEDGCLWCPIHNGVFDIATGKACGGPVTDLKTYAVRVVGDEVEVSASPRTAEPSNAEPLER